MVNISFVIALLQILEFFKHEQHPCALNNYYKDVNGNTSKAYQYLYGNCIVYGDQEEEF